MQKTKNAGNTSPLKTLIIYSRTYLGLFFMPVFLTDFQVNISLGIIHHFFQKYCIEGFSFAIKLIVAGLNFYIMIDFMFKRSVKKSVKPMSLKIE